jgi:hypothetical protein
MFAASPKPISLKSVLDSASSDDRLLHLVVFSELHEKQQAHDSKTQIYNPM